MSNQNYRRISQRNGLGSSQINNMLKDLRNYEGIFSKDTLPKDLKHNSWYVINMQNHNDGNGTHWVCLKTGIPLTYFDSFGFAPPIEVMEKVKNGMSFNKREIQDYNSTACGWFCIACIRSDCDASGTTTNHFKRFLSKFSDNTLVNDIILHTILDKLGID